jgi:glycosyltransferase involved in cell wall biosynthesis
MRKLNIGIIIETKINVGGAFNQAINHIQIFKSFNQEKFSISIFTTNKENIIELEKIGINAEFIKTSLIDRYIAYASTSVLLRRIQFMFKFISNFEKLLIRNNVRLVYFLSPGTRCLMLQKTNYIINLWDLCHRDMLLFPENRSFNKFVEYEFVYRATLAQALLVITDSDELSNKLEKFYGLNEKQLLSIPYTPSPYFKYIVPSRSVLKKYNIIGDYFFYPAQFWPHKNHIRILQALKYLQDSGILLKVVFTGFDHGNLGYIKNFINENNLNSSVKILGFIDAEDLPSLYSFSSALIMPTYYGPTNLPPLEAWSLGVPVLYSYLFKEQTLNGAMYFNPDCFVSLAECMLKIYEDKDLREELINNGKNQLSLLMKRHSEQISNLNKFFETLVLRLECYE